MSDDQFTEREVYFSLNGTTNVNLAAQMIFFGQVCFFKMLAVLITSARRKVTKLCYEKVFSFIIKLQCYRLKLLNWCQKKLV